MKQQGIELLRYIPHNAFIARLNNISSKQITALPSLNYFGEYLPEYKIDKRLLKNQNVATVDAPIDVKIQLAPMFRPEDRLALAKYIVAVYGESILRWGNIVNAKIKTTSLNKIAESPAVLWLEPSPQMRLYDEVSTKIVAGDTFTPGSYALVHQLGFDGRGVIVAVADSGLNNGDAETMHPDLAGRVDAFFYYGNLTDAADEHSHGTHVAGIIAGNAATGKKDENGFLYGLGVAPAAHLVAQRIFDGYGVYQPPPSFETLTRDAVNAGAYIGSNSWGDDTQGRYDLSAAEFDALVRDANAIAPGDQQYVLEFSAGNAGPAAQTIGSPAVAKNVIATGATENNRGDFFIYGDGPDVVADFSSRGPAEDGRIKPDVVAPGTWIASLQSASATDEYAWTPISSYYQYQGGTSQAGPHVSGAAAVFIQYYRQLYSSTPSPALVKAALINSAVDLDDQMGTDPVPNFDEGWGRVDLTQIIGSDKKYIYVDQTTPLRTGQSYEKRIVIASSDQPLKITLAYTDVPALPAAIPALVNDLDLVVIAPDGSIYRGNQFDYGESIPNPPMSDIINNVEAVHISEPVPGEYIIRVIAKNVPEDARFDTPSVDQDFALVVSGDIPSPGVGVLFFDKRYYPANSTAVIKLYDTDLAGARNISISVKSDTEPLGEAIILYPSTTAGMFTGTVQIVTGQVLQDGKLQVNHNDTITAYYNDASPVSLQIATAKVDHLPPSITNITVTNQYGKAFISWVSDEPVTGIVIYGTNIPPTSYATNRILQTAQEVELKNLIKNATYRFAVVAIDEAGNATTNNNNGSYYSFVAIPAASLLLVNAYTPFSLDPSPIIPLSEYTDAINQTGVSYEIWDVSSRGSPTTNDLKPYKCVFWRVNDSLWGGLVGYQGLTLSEQSTLQQYVKEGGSLLICSMELLSRMGTSSTSLAFKSNVLQVVSFTEDAGVSSMEGTPYDSVSSGIAVDLDYSNYDADFWELIGQTTDVSDTLTISTNAAPIYFDSATGDVVGLRYPRFGQPSLGRVVFLSVPFDTIPKTGSSPNNRASILRNILGFLLPGASGLGTLMLDSSAYTIPSRVQIEMADSDLEGKLTATVRVYTTTAPAGINVVLNETVRQGLFTGLFALIAETNQLQIGYLPAKNGDLVWVEYYDESARSIVLVAADVDTIPATITNISVEPDYEQATIYWETDEPTDSLVQFGESTFLGRTAYRSEYKTEHFLTLQGLQPDRTYYYQVVSRDRAGNTTIDDNGGRLYTFRTLTPLRAPVFENFDTGSSGWTVYSSEESQAQWEIGIPDNGEETSAHSPPYAYGSNLRGSVIDIGDTFLISPAIELTGGNKATLRFWHSHDFTERTEFDVIELGELVIITNQLSDPIILNQYFDYSGRWIEEEVDLTPYLGRVVYLVWHYQLLSLGSAPRPGWLVDDISITVSNTPVGSIQVVNNIFQSSFNIVGARNFNGRGKFATFTNAPAGQYIIVYNPVEYYNTPSPQTNYLQPDGTLVFNGVYTITDNNGNGVSDEWELAFFSSTNINAYVDPDGDGMSNYAEFLAGTDPLNTLSRLQLDWTLASNNRLILRVSSNPSRGYRLLQSTNLINWTPQYDWFIATNTITIFNITNTMSPVYFRLESSP